MSHDASKQLLGATNSSAKDAISAFDSDPATYEAGLAVRVNSSNVLSVTKAHGEWAGISLGKSLSDHKKTAVIRAGNAVPILLTDLAAAATGTVTIDDYSKAHTGGGDTVEVAGVEFVGQTGAVTLGDATFRCHTDDATTAASLAAQINGHAVASLLVEAVAVTDTVTITALEAGVAGNSITLVYTDGDADTGITVSGSGTLEGGVDSYAYVVKGEKVYISDSTGKANDSGESNVTISDAIFVSGVLEGIKEDGTSVDCALVDMGGGL